MKSKFFYVFFLLICFSSFAQEEITWQDLAQVEFVDKYFPDYGQYFLYPEFSSSVQALDGTEVTITGYFLDIDPEGEIFILSQGPMSACFFCGIGGPETAMEVHFSSKPSFKMDDIITVTGTLKLNADDVNHFNYILKDSKGKLAE